MEYICVKCGAAILPPQERVLIRARKQLEPENATKAMFVHPHCYERMLRREPEQKPEPEQQPIVPPATPKAKTQDAERKLALKFFSSALFQLAVKEARETLEDDDPDSASDKSAARAFCKRYRALHLALTGEEAPELVGLKERDAKKPKQRSRSRKHGN